MSMSHEDRPGNDPFGVYQDEEAGRLTSSQPVLNGDPDAMEVVDPLGLWAVTSGRPLTSSPSFRTSTLYSPPGQLKSDANALPQPERQNRRKFVKLLVVGAAGLVTAITVGGVSFARAPHGMTLSPPRIDDDKNEGSTSFDAHKEMDDGDLGRRGKRPHKPPTPSKSPTPRPSPSPTQTQTPQPTMTTTPTGTVIGSTSQATNSAVSFTNPADKQGSLLIHLGNGNWVACESACTHQGCTVNYNSQNQQLVCPCHSAAFDPSNGFSYVPGSGPPGLSPLPQVTIHVNANGTITTP